MNFGQVVIKIFVLKKSQ